MQSILMDGFTPKCIRALGSCLIGMGLQIKDPQPLKCALFTWRGKRKAVSLCSWLFLHIESGGFMALLEQLKTDRQTLHQIPELEFELPKTHAYIKKRLETMGYETQTVAKSGVVAKKAGVSDQAIAFRADMDALDVEEMTASSFKSQTQGRMHACGHDGHMSMLLGLAQLLADAPTPKKTIVFIFQPAEEGPGGAREIVKEGVLNTYHVEAIYGIHLYPSLKAGAIGMRAGAMMAQNGEFDVHVHGKSAHGAAPHDGHDAINAMVSIYGSFQDLTNKMIDPLVPSLLAIGKMGGGEMRNILAKHAYFEGTIRTFSEATYANIKKHMHRIAAHTAESYGVKAELAIRDFYPPVINDAALVNQAFDALASMDTRTIEPMMLAEDFAFYQQAIPGLFMMLGVRNEKTGHTHPLHSGHFNFDEKVLINGVRAYAHILAHNDIIDLFKSTDELQSESR